MPETRQIGPSIYVRQPGLGGTMARSPSRLGLIFVGVFFLVPCAMPSLSQADERHLSAAEIDAIPSAFPTTLVPPNNPSLRPLFLRLQELSNPEGSGKLVSEVLSLGAVRVPFSVEECGASDVSYSRKKRRITLCYEFIVEVNRLLGKSRAQWFQVDSTTAAVLVFAALHEIGHALVHVLNLSVVGREEDSADQFAILLMTQVADSAFARRIVQAPSAFFYRHGVEVEGTAGHDVDDAHGTSAQRAGEALCLLYGRHRDAALGQTLGPAASGCIERAARIAAVWNARLAPYTRVAGGRMF